ncbi:unnamed protein product [Amoebophrya sp. A25]|nr:unnamed protein product [Amoebophrya sp. A25]|eukprot:GSA25T00017086001.1
MVRKCPGKAAVIGTTMYLSTVDSRERAPNATGTDEGNAVEADANAFLEVDKQELLVSRERRLAATKSSEGRKGSANDKATAVEVGERIDREILEQAKVLGQKYTPEQISGFIFPDIPAVTDNELTDVMRMKEHLTSVDARYLLALTNVDFLKHLHDEFRPEYSVELADVLRYYWTLACGFRHFYTVSSRQEAHLDDGKIEEEWERLIEEKSEAVEGGWVRKSEKHIVLSKKYRQFAQVIDSRIRSGTEWDPKVLADIREARKTLDDQTRLRDGSGKADQAPPKDEPTPGGFRDGSDKTADEAPPKDEPTHGGLRGGSSKADATEECGRANDHGEEPSCFTQSGDACGLM